MNFHHQKGDNVNLCAYTYIAENPIEDPSDVLMMTTVTKASGNNFQP